MIMFGPKSHLATRDNHLFIEDVDSVLLAQQYGTLLYVTSEKDCVRTFALITELFPMQTSTSQ